MYRERYRDKIDKILISWKMQTLIHFIVHIYHPCFFFVYFIFWNIYTTTQSDSRIRLRWWRQWCWYIHWYWWFSWIGRDYRCVSRVMLFPCFSSASLKGVLWSGLSHYEATVWCRRERDGRRWMDHLRSLRRLICISNSSVHHALLTVAIMFDVC